MSTDGGLSGLFQKNLPLAFWQRIETGGTGLGIPDSHYIYQRRAGWIEFKLTSAYAVGLSPEQVGWIFRYSRAGGRALIAVRKQTEEGPRRGPATDGLWIFPGSRVKELAVNGLRCGGELACFAGPPRTWNWAEIACLL